MTDVCGELLTITVLSDVHASSFDEFGNATNQRSAMPSADWLSARDERGGPQFALMDLHFVYCGFCSALSVPFGCLGQFWLYFGQFRTVLVPDSIYIDWRII